MKIALKMLGAALISLLMGIACASPLIVTELNYRPWLRSIQGPTAEFGVSLIYANFTLLNPDTPVTQDNGPTIEYFAVLNITNLAGIDAKLFIAHFFAAREITDYSNLQLTNGGKGWKAPGAWVDGKWYNLTLVNVGYPSFRLSDNMTVGEPLEEPYWMEGVQIFDRYVNGTLAATYLNMNGTWTDVTGRIEVERPQNGDSYSIKGQLVNDMHIFWTAEEDDYSSNGTTISQNGEWNMVNHYASKDMGLFDNNWAPNQSRLLMISGSLEIRQTLENKKMVEILQSGNLMFKTIVKSIVETDYRTVNNTALDTSFETTEVEQVQLTQNGNSYIHNASALDNQDFLADQWGIEVFVKPGS